MPRTRIYESNAARQKAYRERQKKGLVTPDPKAGSTAVVRRVMAADAKSQ